MTRPLPPLLLSPFFLLLLAASCAAQGEGPRFQCSAAARCQALAGYVPTNATTYDAIKTLFEVKSIRSLFGANNLPPSTSASARVPAGTLVRVPFPCACANGTGVSDRRPVYTVVKDDTLFNIASQIFRAFVVFPQIAARNNISDPSLIEVGQRLWIPLPCSCDPVDGADAVHLAYIVPSGSNMSYIADQFGTTAGTLGRINNISNSQDLMGGQVLDVPLRVCNSSIQSDSPDSAMRVPVGSYALTAKNCVRCSCSSSSWRLQCEMAQDLNFTRGLCPAATCSTTSMNGTAISLGGSVPTACGSIQCEYAGFNSANNTIFAVTNQSACGTTPATGPPGSGAPASWTRRQQLLAPLGAALLLSAVL